MNKNARSERDREKNMMVNKEIETYVEKDTSTTRWREMDNEEREKTAATETPRRAINKFDMGVGKLAKLPASGVST